MEEFTHTFLSLSIQSHAVEIVAQHMCTDLPDSFNHSFLGLCGYSMSRVAAQRCLREAGMSMGDVDVVELHDCFAPAEVCFVGSGTPVYLSVDHKQYLLSATLIMNITETKKPQNQTLIDMKRGLECMSLPIASLKCNGMISAYLMSG